MSNKVDKIVEVAEEVQNKKKPVPAKDAGQPDQSPQNLKQMLAEQQKRDVQIVKAQIQQLMEKYEMRFQVVARSERTGEEVSIEALLGDNWMPFVFVVPAG